jgi:hypothetical protein
VRSYGPLVVLGFNPMWFILAVLVLYALGIGGLFLFP